EAEHQVEHPGLQPGEVRQSAPDEADGAEALAPSLRDCAVERGRVTLDVHHLIGAPGQFQGETPQPGAYVQHGAHVGQPPLQFAPDQEMRRGGGEVGVAGGFARRRIAAPVSVGARGHALSARTRIFTATRARRMPSSYNRISGTATSVWLNGSKVGVMTA